MESPSHEMFEQITTGLMKLSLAMKSRSWNATFPLHITPTQSQILTIISRYPDGVRLKEISEELGVTAPTASDAVSLLWKKGLVSKIRLQSNQRSIMIRLTSAGRKMEEKSSVWPNFLTASLDTLSAKEQEVFLRVIIKMIISLQQRGQIPCVRMCVGCQFFDPFKYKDSNKPHHCNFVDSAFGEDQLRIECSDFIATHDERTKRRWLEMNANENKRTA